MKEVINLTIEKVRKELMGKIDDKNQIQVEKVDRYINLLKIFYKLDETIEELGHMVITENASQRFLKPNPAIAEKNKINGSLLALEKSFNFGNEENKVGKGVDDLL